MTYEEIVDGLQSLEAKDFDYYNTSMNGLEQLYALLDAVMALPVPERALPELFKVMERLSDSDLGPPGPLVRTLENMECTDELIASVQSCPSTLAVCMVNRVLNTNLSHDKRKFYLDLLKSVTKHPKASKRLHDVAQRLIDYQISKDKRKSATTQPS